MSLVLQARFNLAHSVWALDRLIHHAATLDHTAIEREMGIGPGGLRENIAHTVEAMFFFADNFRGTAYIERPTFEADSRSLAGLGRLLDAAGTELRSAMLAALAREPSANVMWPTAESGTMPAVAALAQTFDHSTLHRTQAINMLKRLGVSPVPDLDPLTFLATGSPW